MWFARSGKLAMTAAALLTLSACVTAPPGVTTAGQSRPITLGGDPPRAAASMPWAQSAVYMASGPSLVELTSVPVGEYAPKTKLDRGWAPNGKVKRQPGPISEAAMDRLRVAARSLPPNGSLQRAQVVGANGPTPGIGFDSID